MFNSLLRRKALEAMLEGVGVPEAGRKEIADAINKNLLEGYLMQDTQKPKPGWKTTEFWLSLFSMAGTTLGAIAHFIPPQAATIATAVIGAGYSIARGLSKTNTAAPSVDPPKGVD